MGNVALRFVPPIQFVPLIPISAKPPNISRMPIITSVVLGDPSKKRAGRTPRTNNVAPIRATKMPTRISPPFPRPDGAIDQFVP